MKPTRYTLPGMAAIRQVSNATRSSVVLRTILVGTLAIGVTIGSVVAGALVIAPVVARATQPNATAQLVQSLATVSAASSAVFHRSLAAVQASLEQLPAPVSQYAFPGIVAITMVGLISTLLLRRSTPHRSLVPAQTAFAPSPRTMERLTTPANQKGSGRHQKTPKAINALAASGASSTDIAWRTGLPIDAVQLLLALANTPRQFQPPTA